MSLDGRRAVELLSRRGHDVHGAGAGWGILVAGLRHPASPMRKLGAMYASIRQYNGRNVPEFARRVQEGFVPIVRQVPGFVAWYLVDGGGGALFTITLCEDRAGAEASVSAAADWVPENVGDLVQGYPAVINGEVRVQA